MGDNAKRIHKSTRGRSRARNVAHEPVISSLNSNAACIDELRTIYVELRRGLIDQPTAKTCCALLRELRQALADEKMLNDFGADLETLKRTYAANGGPPSMVGRGL